MQLPPWAVPFGIGVIAGWFFSGTLSRLTGGLHLPSLGGKAAYAYPVERTEPTRRAPLSPSAAWPRRSFDREYGSWLETTVNATPTIG